MSTDPGSRPEAKSSTFGESFEQVFGEELDCLRERWQAVYPDKQERAKRGDPRPKPTTENELVGLAFSGGGIRSATINMGIAQALHRRGVFDHVDYMSTVSGGGYLGSSISTAMRELPEADPTKPEEEQPPRHKGEFPYAYQEPATSDDATPPGEQREVETKFLTWVRNNSNYMATGGFLDWPRIFGVLLRGILINFLVLLPILLALAVGLVWYHGDDLAAWDARDQEIADARETAATAAEKAARLDRFAVGGDAQVRDQALQAEEEARRAAEVVKEELEKDAALGSHFKVSIWIAGVFVFFTLVFPVMIRVYKVFQRDEEEESSVETRGYVEMGFGGLLVLIAIAAAAEALPLLIRWFHHFEGTGLRGLYSGAASGGAVAVIATAGKALSKLGGVRQKIALLLVGLLGLIIPLVVALYVADDLIYFHPQRGDTEAQTRAFAEDGKPQYEVSSYRPMQFREPFGETGFVRLLPGILLLIMGGGLGAAIVGRLMRKGRARTILATVGVAAGAFGAYYLLVVSSQALAWLCGELGAPQAGIRPDMLVLAMAVVVFFYCWAAVDVNLTAVLGLYRDRLAAAYLIGVEKVKDAKGNLVEKIFVEPDLNLEELCGGTPDSLKKKKAGKLKREDIEICCCSSKAPYHIVNTALNLQGSSDPMLRDRGSDFFMFSKLYYGGHRTGYCETWRLEKVFPQMDLPTAMAISAAAASPNSGRMTSKPLVALMTLLNVRLGYWVPHPGRLFDWLKRKNIVKPRLKHRWGWRVPPWALLREMVSGVNENHKWVNLSDGGHIENMAVYELLRRRCKYIICGDGEADPGLTFGGLATLMRSARIDMGIEIEILLDDVRLGDDGKSHQHAALGKIVYPSEHRQVRAEQAGNCPVCRQELRDYGDRVEGETPADGGTRYRCPRGELEVGHLLYVKSSFTGNEDETMQEYRANSPDFPHETTADQFFDEGQFEAYRALGFHMADGLFPAVKPGQNARTHGDWDRFTRWFERLRSDLAPRLSAKHEALQEQLRRIAKLLQREEFEDYFYELNPLLEGLEDKKEGPRKKASMQQIYYLVGLQLDLMESAFLGLSLDQPVNWNHPGNQGWRKMFEDWSRSESFKIGYSLLSHLHSGRFQNFCRRNLGLVPAAELFGPG